MRMNRGVQAKGTVSRRGPGARGGAVDGTPCRRPGTERGCQQGKGGPCPRETAACPQGWERTSPCPLSFSILSGHVLREVSGDPFLSVCHMSVSPYLSSTIGLFVDIYHLYLYHVSCLTSINYLLSIYLLFISVIYQVSYIYLSIMYHYLSIMHLSIIYLPFSLSLSPFYLFPSFLLLVPPPNFPRHS